jgi:hypothetical protein
VSLTFTLHAAETACNTVISNCLEPNVVGMARAVLRSAGIEGCVTCHRPRVGALPNCSSISVVCLRDFIVGVLVTAMVSKPVTVVTKTRCVWLPEETLRHAGLCGVAQKAQSGGREQGRYTACCLGCGRANITKAGTRGLQAVIAPRERKLRPVQLGQGHCGFLAWRAREGLRGS